MQNLWKMDENVSHIVVECNELAQNEYKKLKHDKFASSLHWQWRKTYEFKKHEKYYEHFIEKETKILENDKFKILWDFQYKLRRKLTVISQI